MNRFVFFLGLLFPAFPAAPYDVITDIHVDVGSVTYSEEGGLQARVHTSGANYSPSSVLIYDGPSGTTSTTRPSGGQWDFLGVEAGETIYYWPQSQVSGRIYAGFEAQSVASGTFASYLPDDSRVADAASWITVELVDVRFFDLSGNAAEADFSIWTVPGVGQSPTVWMSTADGIDASDVFYLTEGGHSHANWGFTQAGYYQIDLRFSGILEETGEVIRSDVATYNLGVEYQPSAVPEPRVPALLALAAAGWLLRRSFRRIPTHSRP